MLLSALQMTFLLLLRGKTCLHGILCNFRKDAYPKRHVRNGYEAKLVPHDLGSPLLDNVAKVSQASNATPAKTASPGVEALPKHAWPGSEDCLHAYV